MQLCPDCLGQIAAECVAALLEGTDALGRASTYTAVTACAASIAAAKRDPTMPEDQLVARDLMLCSQAYATFAAGLFAEGRD